MDTVQFDKMVAQYYVNKVQSCRTREIEFNLTFTQVKNMLRAKKCQYTGVTLTKSTSSSQLPTDVTIERIDPSKAYETGNVCAVSYAANQAKSAFDKIYGKDSYKMFLLMAKNMKSKINLKK